ncbi:hypothetical protein [Roseicyclus sp.]|uniref:hypothetical protein n=1 Tax=Roseicyclus sp. TaxID=1914329 RepID=UPI003BAE2E2D|nr:hypothetical protein [Pseudomonadota bacterium]
MDHKDYVQYARNLYDAHGAKAEAEAAQKAASARAAGQAENAATWEKIRAQIRELRGAYQG